jgi:hypothetical protein
MGKLNPCKFLQNTGLSIAGISSTEISDVTTFRILFNVVMLSGICFLLLSEFSQKQAIIIP